VRRGLIERQPSKNDRRRAELTLTAEGRAMVATAPETIQERLLRGFDELDATSRATLAEHLESWLTASLLDDVTPALFFEPSPGAGDADRVELPSGVGAPQSNDGERDLERR
jgi:hypothetical protein